MATARQTALLLRVTSNLTKPSSPVHRVFTRTFVISNRKVSTNTLESNGNMNCPSVPLAPVVPDITFDSQHQQASESAEQILQLNALFDQHDSQWPVGITNIPPCLISSQPVPPYQTAQLTEAATELNALFDQQEPQWPVGVTAQRMGL